MAGTALQLTLADLAAAAGRKAQEWRTLSLRPAMQRCGLLMASDAKERIATSTDVEGRAFLPLQRPRSHGRGGTKPLYDSGVLIGSITSSATDDTATAGTTVKYARIHNQGGTIHLPARRARPGKVYRFRDRAGRVVFTRTVRATTVQIPQRQYSGWSPRLTDRCTRVLVEYATPRLVAFG